MRRRFPGIMQLVSRIPLAWKNLTHQGKRMALAVGGIGFAVLLMFMQLGFQNALFDSTVQLPRQFNADLVLVSKAKFTVTVTERFPLRRLQQALGRPEVKAVYPLYIEANFAFWKHPLAPRALPVFVLAYNPTEPVLLNEEVQAQSERLLLPGRVLFDRMSKGDYGSIAPGSKGEISGTRVEVVGGFDLGTNFATDGTVIMSDRTFQQTFYPPPARAQALERVDIGLIRLHPGADVADVQRRLATLLPEDVKVLTKDRYVVEEIEFWNKSTPIGYIFAFGTSLGFVVGFIVCFQILYADIADHLPEYATLKAMGYRNLFFILVVLEESILLSALGFVPGYIISRLLYALLGAATGLPLNLTLGVAGLVLTLTMAMCALAGVFTMRTVLTVDPAELFR